MKKFILILSMLALVLPGFSKSKTKKKSVEPVTYKRPDLGKVLADGTEPNPLIETDLEGVFVFHPYESMENKINNGSMFAINIISNETNKVLWTIDQVVSFWQGMRGWSGQVVEEDYTFVTADYLQFVVKADKYTVKPDIPEGYVFGDMPNPLEKSDIYNIFLLKPAYSQYTKELIDFGDEYTAKITDKKTGEVVLTLDNVVRDWQGMSGWSGRVVTDDYTFITSDIKQYVVKAETYVVLYEK